MSNLAVVLLFLLTIKHWLADGYLQTAYQYKNKGKYGHPGGLLHALIHGWFTVLIFLPWLPVGKALTVAVLDMVLHYHIDWLKVWSGQKTDWSRMVRGTFNHSSTSQTITMVDINLKEGLFISSDKYFYALIADQCAHFATYVFLVWMVLRF